MEKISKRTRSFNSLILNHSKGIVTKKSDNKEKIKQELLWYLNLPAGLKKYSPKLIDYENSKTNVGYSLELCSYPTLADLFVNLSLDLKTWEKVIGELFEIINLFKKYKKNLPYISYRYMYYEKIIERLNELKKEKYWKDLLNEKYIYINKKKYKNINLILEKIKKTVDLLFDKNEMSFVHGDLCLSNILYDKKKKVFKFIDPRGSFGEISNYGDIKYDIAKLRHSFHGFYDFIMNDLFEIEEKGKNFDFIIFVKKNHLKIADLLDREVIKRGYDLRKISIIESLLFLSMVPLHRESFRRQKAMFLSGIKLINEAIF